jgi:hypothetical protein
MKTKLFTIALSVIFARSLSMPTEVSAHNNHRVPVWTPAHGYRAQTRHVYFPKYNMYYDIQRGVYISVNNGRWSASMDLPIRFGNVNFRSARYVELNVNSHAPQCYNDDNYYNDNRRYNNDDRRYSEYRRDNRHNDEYRNDRDDRRWNNREERRNHNGRDDD